MAQTRQMMMLIPCGAHTNAVVDTLDAVGVSNWVIIQTTQCRRMGHLEYSPPEHEWTCDVIIGMADAPTVKRTLDAVAEAVHRGKVCPDCLAYVWEAEQALLAVSSIDPVCEMAVDRVEALSVKHEGVTYYFCSPECRDRFMGDPEAFVRKSKAA